jgi:DNA-binding CsgD family transcriptional regulator
MKSLTPAEGRVFEEALTAKSQKEIAAALNVSLRMVKAHLSQIYRKTGCRDRLELLVIFTVAGRGDA